MITWIYRILLYILLFGVSGLSYGGNSIHPLLDKVMSLTALLGIVGLVVGYMYFPRFYKVMAWPLLLGVILLVLESKYEYGQYVYSFFVIKRFAYCALALSAFVVMERAGAPKLAYANYLIYGLFFFNQILLGQIFSYGLTSDTRTTTAPEALYLVLPFLYYLVLYLKEHKLVHLGVSLLTFGFIVFLLHRSVISTAVIAAGVVVGLTGLGRLANGTLPIGKTMAIIGLILLFVIPSIGLLPEKKMNSFVSSLEGILNPEEDNTGSWRVEQSTHYMKLYPERPLLGWRYEGYDRGEVMENEDFPQRGTIIHSQYVDMLYNYGAIGLIINLLIIIGTLAIMYRRNAVFTTEQMALFGFIFSGLIFAVSYQLPMQFWGFVGLGLYYGLKRPASSYPSQPTNTPQPDYAYAPRPVRAIKTNLSV